MYPRSTYSINGLRTKERRQCGNSTPRKDGQGRVPVGNQKGLFGHCRSCRLCETGLPRERTDHQPAGGRRTTGQKGQLIAAIDPRDLALQYAADKSAYETAAAQVERNKRLLARQAISVQEYEISVSTFQQKKSAYELSSNNMRDTKLTAPFDGSIEKRLVENYQRVNSGEGIVQLVNTKKLRIKFTIPDAYLYLLRSKDQHFRVEFDTYRGHIFNAKLEEYLDISTDGTGIPVTITIDDPAFDHALYEVKPGFTCSIRFSADVGPFLEETMTVVPLSAIFGESEGNKTYVWVLNGNQVNRREVTVYSPTGDAQAFISKGLKAGETVIIAGVTQLVEGETVKELK